MNKLARILLGTTLIQFIALLAVSFLFWNTCKEARTMGDEITALRLVVTREKVANEKEKEAFENRLLKLSIEKKELAAELEDANSSVIRLKEEATILKDALAKTQEIIGTFRHLNTIKEMKASEQGSLIKVPESANK